MTFQLDNKVIRDSSPAELAKYLQVQLKYNDWEVISDRLISSIGSDALPPDVFQVWLAVCKNAEAIVAALRQDVSTLARHVAIRRFGKWLRTDASFSAIWKAVGEVQGLVQLMSTFSVHHISTLCETISLSCKAAGAVVLRRDAISELYNTLCGNDKVRKLDKRPLDHLYRHLIPACNSETVLAYSKTHSPGRKVIDAHISIFEKKAIEELFPSDGEAKKISEFTGVLKRNRRFALLLLERFVANANNLEFNGDMVIGHLINPLLSPLEKARKHNETNHVLSLTLQCAENNEKVAASIDYELIYYAAQNWKRSHNREEAEKLLAGIIAVIPENKWLTLEMVAGLMRQVGPVLRYSLLHIFLLNAKWHRIDINAENEEVNKQLRDMKESWPVDFFLDLVAPAALRLFKRILKAHPDGSFITPGSGHHGNRLVTALAVGSRFVDPETMATYLEAQLCMVVDEKSLWFARAKKTVFERKNKASNSREWEERADWATSALKLAVAAGSLNLYSDTLQWARRFNRDAQAVKRLYEACNVSIEEGFGLLSAIPSSRPKQRLPSLEVIKAAVLKSNNIMYELLETAAMAIKEPSFNEWDWAAIKSLPADVLYRRLERTQIIQERGDWPDDAVTKAIWEPTIEFLVKAEQFGLSPENERLHFDSVPGPLGDWEAVKPTKSICFFLDKLAERRNEIWDQVRRIAYPVTTTLTKPWPTGLPVQLLCPKFDLMTFGLTEMPYLQSRCEAVVFSNCSILDPPPNDQETRDAIGTFIDYYPYALYIYLISAKDKSDRDIRLERAWTHATTELTGARMTSNEAISFWMERAFTHVSCKPDLRTDLESLGLVPRRQRVMPELPEPEDGVPVEWNPWPDWIKSQNLSRDLSQTALDCMLQAIHSYSLDPTRSWSTPLSTCVVKTVGEGHPRIWYVHERYNKKIPGSAQDALVVACIAYINTQYGSDSSLFLRPYPSENDIRIPALYLDEEFLDAHKTRNADYQISALSCFLSRVPLVILSQLARSLLRRLEKSDKEDASVREAAMATIKLLARSDRPEVARSLVQHVVLDRQDDSSWHRHLFNLGFLRRLSIEHAKGFFSKICTVIQQRQAQLVVDQAERKAQRQGQQKAHQEAVSESQTTHESKEELQSTTPMIKVGTIKMIAQMLRSADFVDQGFACDTLVGLLNSSPHPDIQFAIVDGLLSLLVESTDSRLREHVYQVLEKNIIPIVSSVNERHPPREEEWAAAEAGDGNLPEVYEGATMGSLPPLLSLLWEARNRWKDDTSEYREWLIRIVAPVIDRSAVQNARWLSIFIKQNGFEVPEHFLPLLPVKRDLLLQYWGSTPQGLTRANLEVLKRYSMISLRPYDELVTINEAVKKDGDLLKSNAGKHWLYLWDNPSHAAFSNCGISAIVSTLTRPNFDGEGEVTVAELQEFFSYLMADFIAKSELQHFESLYRIGIDISHDIKAKWLANCLPLLDSAIKEIDGLRTESWQRNPLRTPARLPKTFPIKLRIFLNKHQGVGLGNVPVQMEMAAWVADLSKLVEELVTSNEPYHNQWRETLYRARSMLSSNVRVRAAVTIAEAIESQSPKVADNLLVELAEDLFKQQSGTQDEEIVVRARAVLQEWLTSPAEYVRLAAEAVVELLAKQVPNGWFGETGL